MDKQLTEDEIGEAIIRSNERQSDYYQWWDDPKGRLAGLSFEDWRPLYGCWGSKQKH